jgi:Lrp/AsnC family leucine-responsive transcriptional regulator
MDDKDRKILLCLQEHGRWGVQKIAKETRIPITTVYHRMKSLEKEGIIKRYAVVLDHKKLGMPLAAYILVVGKRFNDIDLI